MPTSDPIVPKADSSVIRDEHRSVIWTLAHIFAGKISLPQVDVALGTVTFDSKHLAEIGNDIAGTFNPSSSGRRRDRDDEVAFSDFVAFAAAVFGLGFTVRYEKEGETRSLLPFTVKHAIVQAFYRTLSDQDRHATFLEDELSGKVLVRLHATIDVELSRAPRHALLRNDLAAFSEQKTNAVAKRTDADDALITTLLLGLASVVVAVPVVHGPQSSNFSPSSVSKRRRSLMFSFEGVEQEVVYAAGVARRKIPQYIRNALAPPNDQAGNSTLWASESDFQQAMVDCFKADDQEKTKLLRDTRLSLLDSHARGALVELPALWDPHLDADVLPDLVVCARDASGVLRRVAAVELKASSVSFPSESSDAIKQICQQLYSIMCDNPFRKRAIGFLTNGTGWAIVVEATREFASWREVRFNGIRQGNNTKDDEEVVARVFTWFLQRSAQEMGFAEFPNSFKIKTGVMTENETEFVIGKFLGSGEDCAVYECVGKIAANTRRTVDSSIAEKKFVAKFYFDRTRADREQIIYDIVKQENVPNTTVPYQSQLQEDAAKLNLPFYMRLVTPYGVLFETTTPRNKMGPPSVTKENVEQLVTALTALHRANVVHGDIHEDNIFCAAHEERRPAVLNDFGRARQSDEMPLCEFLFWMQHDWILLGKAVRLCCGKDFWNEIIKTMV
jgi:hypothetical protein